MKTSLKLTFVSFLFAASVFAKTYQADVVIYGGTSSAVAAAVQCAREGKTAIIVAPEKHLGAMSSAGLGFTDSGKTYTIGGVSKEFYHRIWKEYKKPETWKFGNKRENFTAKGQRTKAMDDENQVMWIFEPSVALKVFNDWVVEYPDKIKVFKDEWLDRENGVVKKDGRIESIKTLSGDVYEGKIFIDATFEGDLLASAGCEYHIGREANSVYGETLNGVQKGSPHQGHNFKKPVDPYVVEGNPDSGILKYISTEDPGENGKGDKRIQAYCFRVCLSKVPENRVAFPKPKNYNADDYLLWLRYYKAEARKFIINAPIPNGKTDANNRGAFSTDFIGCNYDYPEASYERRREIIQAHKDYQLGFLYFISNDPRVPKKVRERMSKWGLAKDEFVDNDNWPFNLYIREARRLVGEYVMTENDCTGKVETPKSVGMGSYNMDSHNTQRYISPDGKVQNEGDIQVRCSPYEISYGSIVPKKKDCVNLFVTSACSASHIAYGSIRMEPVFMILGQSAATAAAMAIDQNIAVQDVDYETLSKKLKKDGQILKLEDK